MRYKINDGKITVLSDETLVAGSRERHLVTFDFDESWDGYVKIATFRRGTVCFERILDNGTCEMPREVLAASGILQISVRGESEDGTHEAAYAPFKTVYGGAKGKSGADEPSPDVWQQLLAAIGDIAPHVGDNGHWLVGDVDTGVQAQGPQGECYVLTDADKTEIAEMSATLVDASLAELIGEVE